ncbi:MAG: pentapeptide repeat-containing protein [Thermomicrobiales bacterium]
MDDNNFDRVARVVGGALSRRAALGVLLAALVPGRGDVAARGSGKRPGNARGRGRGKNDAGRGRRKTRAEAVCYGGSPCAVTSSANLANCDFGGSSALKNANCASCNLSGANLKNANAAGVNLKNANLAKACLVDANLTGATMSGSTNLSGALFCRTKMPNGTINNAGCGKSASCCQTCVAIGGVCGAGGDCCGGAACQNGVCACPVGTINCHGACKECCSDANCSGSRSKCCKGICKGCCGDGDCGGNTPLCCNGACQSCCTRGDCPSVPCQTWDCVGGACVEQGTDPDLTTCNAFAPEAGVCCSGECTEGTCCADANCRGDSNRCVDRDPGAGTANTCVCGATGAPCSGATPTCCGAAPGGTCVDLESDENNCGACGKTCGAGQSCCNGSCTATTTCQALGRTCGTAPDGACGTLHCGVCSGSTPSCSNGACATCAATCPGAGCVFCFNLAEGDTVCGRASDVECRLSCTSNADCPVESPYCLASFGNRITGTTSPITAICTTVSIAAACTAITPC